MTAAARRASPTTPAIEAAETCSCGASVTLVNDSVTDYGVLTRYLKDWRRNHRCRPETKGPQALGFPLPVRDESADENDDG